jgi:hypothetical protein
MKKLLLLIPAVLLFFGCTKDELKDNPVTVCVDCTGTLNGYSQEFPDIFCGTNKDADLYIANLKEEGSQVGQSWTCTKH